MTTPTEQAFLTMAKMVGIPVEDWVSNTRAYFVGFNESNAPKTPPWVAMEKVGFGILSPSVDASHMVARKIADGVQLDGDFPIVASTFDALTIERPELREHYERAKEAWEASQ